MAAIECDRLTKRYKQTTVVDEVTFRVESGRVTGFLGPNGAGKTTCLRMITGLVAPTSGTATVLGKTFAGLEDPARSVGVAFEGAAHPGRSGRQHLRLIAAASGIPDERIAEALALVGLDDTAADRKIKGYSLGMCKRLELAAAILGDPKVLILDEPSNGLDPDGIRWLRELLRSLADEGRAVLLSSHALAEVEQIADSIVVLRRRVLFQGTVAELRARSTDGDDALTIRSSDDKALARELASRGLNASQPQGGALLVRGAPTQDVLAAAVAAGVEIREVSRPTATLEEEFFRLLEEPLPETPR
ncbi:ABC transporter ATP-binding protein [Streptomyces chrestomyceticus]|uniref:ABC transporter ATP-binding protein n=1 Tax=Streptomyces chrestomyceticus TaxID=68185 RepID=UPI0033D8B1A5